MIAKVWVFMYFCKMMEVLLIKDWLERSQNGKQFYIVDSYKSYVRRLSDGKEFYVGDNIYARSPNYKTGIGLDVEILCFEFDCKHVRLRHRGREFSLLISFLL